MVELNSGDVAINDQGQVVGSITTSERNQSGHYLMTAAVWEKGRVRTLGPLPSLPMTAAEAVNNRSVIVGQAHDLTVGATTLVHQKAVSWHRGRIEEIPRFVGFSESIATSINNRGEITGYCTEYPPYADLVPTRGFIFRHGELTDLGHLGGKRVYASDINDRAQVVGTASTGSGSGARAFIWEDGKIRALEMLPSGHASMARAINSAGQVVGEVEFLSGAQIKSSAVSWKSGMVRKLLPLDSDDQCSALDINSQAQIVGWSGRGTQQTMAVLWKNCIAIDLNEMIPDGFKYVLKQAKAINSKGQIVAIGTHDQKDAVFLLDPVTK